MPPSNNANSDSYLVIENITKTFGELVALNDISLSVEEGEFVCLLGPSGCGKTTLLRIIAGLEQQNVGQVYQSGEDISRKPPRDRDFGIVFQSYALFPNLTAEENIAYGLENRKVPKDEIQSRVAELLELIGLPDVGKKFPSKLSGGQQQRVALARALAPSPGLLLLDEPLSALDARVRISLRIEIKHLQHRLGITTVFVTHDQEEALVMADRIVVMDQGTIEQVGNAEQIYRSPASPFVANFVGMMNFIPAVIGDEPNQLMIGSISLEGDIPEGLNPGDALTLAIRPEEIQIASQASGLKNLSPATVIETEFLGAVNRLTCSMDDDLHTNLLVEVSSNLMKELLIENGSQLALQFPPEIIRVYPGKLANHT
ncbi:MAG: putative 2-aminoethylphosphonate ABC transporter ATP-binding protein [Anaerolineales bacterium]|nr:putative 2-aminoethylphosphonate ABC transporter ATP-binding protein [Anaerolineales bacterium]